MTLFKKKNIVILLFIIVFFLLGFFLLQWWAKNYVTDLLSQKLPPQFALKYSDLDINILSGDAILYQTELKIKSNDTLQNHTFLKLESLELNGIGYWDLMFNETLSIKNIHLKHPKLHYYPYKKIASNKSESKAKKKGIKTIKFDELNIANGSLDVMKQSTDSVKLSVKSYNLKVSGSKIDLNSETKRPFAFEDYNLNAKNIILGNNEYETIKISSVNTNKDVWQLENLQIAPKYDKQELSRHLSKERDYINLNIPRVILKSLTFNFFEDPFTITVASTEIVEPNLEIYRDKLLPDDLTFKPLYSKSLRTLTFDLAIKQTEIKNGYISYAELVEPDKKAGKIFFNKVDATLKHLTNVKNAEKTDIKIHSELMGEAPLELNWSFDVNNTSDTFEISGAIQNLPANVLNPFFKPNLNALAEGTLQQMYFTFYGNNVTSEGEIKMKYDDFKFNLLRQNSSKINKVLTAIGNIFVSGDSKTNDEGFRFGDIEAERDTTKSFFNYLWINVKSGLVSTLTGNGEK
ncbi:uncharacterized protein DUF748 [Mariniflexile fucanivorans]|uniref:Uncharacterized protein DUF748 n=1 Tax=Mariniflexile fucanivorans TaxID=264023 RepID=A0A4R1RBS9_9FLAO|nr:DUF748 domain-containing protein [Mariniflexile fucanivorans]TCL63159.1 uncharacterized protein DUF748 [Mariniflexile fucanivorans]